MDYNSIKNENNELIDASTISISAKADKGSAPSCVTMAQTILSQLNSNIINKSNLNDVSEDFLEYIIPALATIDKGKNNSAIITCQNKLFNFLSTKERMLSINPLWFPYFFSMSSLTSLYPIGSR